MSTATSASGGELGDFPSALERLDEAVRGACLGLPEWPARIASGVEAALEFAIANPAAARALTIDRITDSNADPARRYERMVSHLTALIRSEAPAGVRGTSPDTDEALVAGMILIVAGYLRADRAEQLREIRGEVTHVILLPYLGFAEAKRWSQQ